MEKLIKCMLIMINERHCVLKMKINLTQNKNLKLFKIISEVAERNNQSVYIVGGYVRDLLMKEKLLRILIL
jgi:hypothetical protein